MRLMDKKVTFNIAPNYFDKTAIVEMATYSHVCRSSSRFKACEIEVLDEDEDQDDLELSSDADSDSRRISICVDSNTLHTLLNSFADQSVSMRLGVRTSEYALIYLTQQEVMVMCLMPHFNQN